MERSNSWERKEKDAGVCIEGERDSAILTRHQRREVQKREERRGFLPVQAREQASTFKGEK